MAKLTFLLFLCIKIQWKSVNNGFIYTSLFTRLFMKGGVIYHAFHTHYAYLLDHCLGLPELADLSAFYILGIVSRDD